MGTTDRDLVAELRQRIRRAHEAHREALGPNGIEDMTLTEALADLFLVMSDPSKAAVAVACALVGTEAAEVHVEWNAVRDGTDPATIDPLLRCDDEERAEVALSAFRRPGRSIYRRTVTYGPWLVVEPEGGE